MMQKNPKIFCTLETKGKGENMEEEDIKLIMEQVKRLQDEVLYWKKAHLELQTQLIKLKKVIYDGQKTNYG